MMTVMKARSAQLVSPLTPGGGGARPGPCLRVRGPGSLSARHINEPIK